MLLTWLPQPLRAAGLTVVEHDGWRTHARPGSYEPRYGVVHATAAPRGQRDSTQVGVVRNGRAKLNGPIANAAIDRDGAWHIIAAGRCNSTLVGTAGPFKGLGNTYALSTEGCNDNVKEPWPTIQYESYVEGWAAWCRHLGWPASKLVGHKEHTPGHKTDPTFNMVNFRRDVAAVLGGDDMGAQDVAAIEKLLAQLEERINGNLRRTAQMILLGGGNNLFDPKVDKWVAAVPSLARLAVAVDELGADIGLSPADLEALRASAREGAEEGARAGADKIADAIPDELAQDVIERLAARLSRLPDPRPDPEDAPAG